MSEKKVLLVSVYTTAFFACFGIMWGIVADSGMIIFDGIYSLISIGLSMLSLQVLKQVQENDEDIRFPFSKAHFEPLVIIFKSLVIIAMCGISAFNALSEILSGGRYVEPGQGVVYALVSTLGCLVVTLVIQQQNQKIASSLLQAERNQWFGDSLLSTGVLLGFSVSYLLIGSHLDWVIPYADPGMVLLASSFFIILPLKSFAAAFKEILLYQVHEDFFLPVDLEAKKIAEELNAEYKLRMVNVGRELNIELNFLLENQSFTVDEMDVIRKRIIAVASTIKARHWVNINFTQDRAWI